MKDGGSLHGCYQWWSWMQLGLNVVFVDIVIRSNKLIMPTARCCIRTCTTSRRSRGGSRFEAQSEGSNPSLHISLHRFPKGDEHRWRRKIWTTLVRKANNWKKWRPKKHTCLCSKHFEKNEQNFYSEDLTRLLLNLSPKKKTILKPEAIPTIYKIRTENNKLKTKIVPLNSLIGEANMPPTASLEQPQATSNNTSEVLGSVTSSQTVPTIIPYGFLNITSQKQHQQPIQMSQLDTSQVYLDQPSQVIETTEADINNCQLDIVVQNLEPVNETSEQDIPFVKQEPPDLLDCDEHKPHKPGMLQSEQELGHGNFIMVLGPEKEKENAPVVKVEPMDVESDQFCWDPSPSPNRPNLNVDPDIRLQNSPELITSSPFNDWEAEEDKQKCQYSKLKIKSEPLEIAHYHSSETESNQAIPSGTADTTSFPDGKDSYSDYLSQLNTTNERNNELSNSRVNAKKSQQGSIVQSTVRVRYRKRTVGCQTIRHVRNVAVQRTAPTRTVAIQIPSFTRDCAVQCEILQPLKAASENEVAEKLESSEPDSPALLPGTVRREQQWVRCLGNAPVPKRKFLVTEHNLLALFEQCPKCHGPAKGRITQELGSAVVIRQECTMCDHFRNWASQPLPQDIVDDDV